MRLNARTFARTFARPALAVVAMVALAGCLGPVARGSAAPPLVIPTWQATADRTLPAASATPTEAGPLVTPAMTTDAAGVGSPPDAVLAVEGGDPVAGQLGTYTWGTGGSDSPWLPGTAMQAATGEVLSVTLSPDVAASDWSAVVVPAANGDETGAVQVGAGPGPMDIATPAAGSWTLAVTIRFGDRGRATWFWLLEVP